MPNERYDHDDETEREDREGGRGASSTFQEFDCPSCTANNPSGDPFGAGEEVLCNYCGTAYAVKVTDDGKLRLREL